MLVLSRREGERIQIGDHITLVVSRIIGNRVTIGLEVPPEVRIVRAELDRHERKDNAPGTES